MRILAKNSILGYLFTQILVVLISAMVLIDNLRSNLYPSAEDSILIPLFDIVIISVILLFIAAVQALLYKRKSFSTSGPLSKFIQIVLLLATISLLVGNIFYWMRPNYVLISVSYTVSLIVYATHISIKLLGKGKFLES